MLCPKCKSEEWNGSGDRPWNSGEGLVCGKCGFKIDQYLPSPNKIIWHPKDIEYYKEFPAPLHENMQRMHYANLNSTITFFGPMLYYFARAVEAHRVLEIGHAEGFTSFYLANAVKDNGTRYEVTDGEYIGIDIVQTDSTREKLLAEGLPAKVINMDSMTLKADTFGDKPFDIIFQDGAHDEEHVLYELETMYPALRGQGFGYWIMHDIFGPAEESYHKILKMIPEKYNFQHCGIWSSSYGLGIFKKMDGYDYEKRYWVD
jgi:predicted O-methyltransferase YrrM